MPFSPMKRIFIETYKNNEHQKCTCALKNIKWVSKTTIMHNCLYFFKVWNNFTNKTCAACRPEPISKCIFRKTNSATIIYSCLTLSQLPSSRLYFVYEISFHIRQTGFKLSFHEMQFRVNLQHIWHLILLYIIKGLYSLFYFVLLWDYIWKLKLLRIQLIIWSCMIHHDHE